MRACALPSIACVEDGVKGSAISSETGRRNAGIGRCFHSYPVQERDYAKYAEKGRAAGVRDQTFYGKAKGKHWMTL